MISHGCEVRFEVGPQRFRTRCLGEDPGACARLCRFGRLVDDFLHEVTLSGEVVTDEAPADPQSLSDPSERRAGALLAIDLLAWRIVAAMFDRERLVTGRRG